MAPKGLSRRSKSKTTKEQNTAPDAPTVISTSPTQPSPDTHASSSKRLTSIIPPQTSDPLFTTTNKEELNVFLGIFEIFEDTKKDEKLADFLMENSECLCLYKKFVDEQLKDQAITAEEQKYSININYRINIKERLRKLNGINTAALNTTETEELERKIILRSDVNKFITNETKFIEDLNESITNIRQRIIHLDILSKKTASAGSSMVALGTTDSTRSIANL